MIRGDTFHFEIVSVESSRALDGYMQSHRSLPLGNGIITVDNNAQAWARAKPSELDKGGDAARAAIAMIRIKRRLAKRGMTGAKKIAAPKGHRRQSQSARRGASGGGAGTLSDGNCRCAGINDIFAEFESHWLGSEVEGEKYLPCGSRLFQGRRVGRGARPDQARSIAR